jgi:GT2 family glycosyltransferase
MSNPVLMLACNNLELTKRAVASIQAQDISTDILLIDNDSTDGTLNWAQDQVSHVVCFRPQLGVSAGWNWGLRWFFEHDCEDHVLVCNNDIELPTWGYRALLGYLILGAEFVTGCSTESRDLLSPAGHPPVPHPDFSCFLISRSAWEKVGEFDERMKLYAQDNDYHVRAYRLGVELLRADVPFYHERSSTLNHAMAQERAAIQCQANSDREVFKSLYGCMPWEPAYQELFK